MWVLKIQNFCEKFCKNVENEKIKIKIFKIQYYC